MTTAEHAAWIAASRKPATSKPAANLYHYEGWTEVISTRPGGRTLAHHQRIGGSVVHAGDIASCRAALLARQAGRRTEISVTDSGQVARATKKTPLV